ncbi:MAG: GNAT family N-acetyltransferase, partial [Actinomycetota bacterium]
MKLELPGNVVARAPEPADLGAVIEVVAASELAATGIVDVTLEDVRSDWQRPSFDLAKDAVVVTDGGRLVAYAEVFAGRAWVHVHPEFRGRGIGAALLRWTETRARDLGSEKLGQTVSDDEPSAAALLVSNGYAVRWHTWVFHKALDDELAEPTLPAGLTLRTFEAGRDDRATFELIDTAFSDWPDR